MIPRITAVLTRVKTDGAAQLEPDAMMAGCREAGSPSWRDRVLTPVPTIQLFLGQILHGHPACSHVPPLSGLRCSASAYCQARASLPLRLFGLRLPRLCPSAQSRLSAEGRWHGQRPFFGAGAGGSRPATPARQAAFGPSTAQRPGCGRPPAHRLGLFPAGTGVLRKRVAAPLLTHDLAHGPAAHPSVHAGDVLVADRGPCPSAHLALLVHAGLHAVRRVGARQIVAFAPGRPFVTPRVRRTPAVKGLPRSRGLKALGGHDQPVGWLKPKPCPSWLTREPLAPLPDSRALREVRYRIRTPGFRTREVTLVTTRLDAQTSCVSALAELYRQRWQGETALSHLKTTRQMEVLQCKTVPGALKEWTAFALVDNPVRLVRSQSATRQHRSIERIRFIAALRWLGALGPEVPLAALLGKPLRPHRVEPRVKKRRPKSFPLMMNPRQARPPQRVQQEFHA